MKKLLRVVLLLISGFSFGQLKSFIINSDTEERIPLVNIWVENENIGTTANKDGEFHLKIKKPKTIIFSAIGFETKKIKSDSIKEFVKLKPIITELNEVILVTKKKNKRLTIGKFKKFTPNYYFGCGMTPWIVAKHYKYKEDYKKTPFLEKIKIKTMSEIKDSKFNIRFYSVNEKGEPKNYIYEKNIIGIAKMGKETTEIDVSKLNIKFPKKGLFVAFEWLIIEENKNEVNYTHKSSNKIKYEPTIKFSKSKKEEKTWKFVKAKWEEMNINSIEMILKLTN